MGFVKLWTNGNNNEESGGALCLAIFMKQNQLQALTRNQVKIGDHLRNAHTEIVKAAMILSDVSLGKIREDSLIDGFISALKGKPQQFTYINSDGKQYRVTISEKKIRARKLRANIFQDERS